MTSVCKILYGSPGYEVHFQEVLDRLEGGDVQKKHALEMAVKSGKVSVIVVYICIFVSDLRRGFLEFLILH